MSKDVEQLFENTIRDISFIADKLCGDLDNAFESTEKLPVEIEENAPMTMQAGILRELYESHCKQIQDTSSVEAKVVTEANKAIESLENHLNEQRSEIELRKERYRDLEKKLRDLEELQKLKVSLKIRQTITRTYFAHDEQDTVVGCIISDNPPRCECFKLPNNDGVADQLWKRLGDIHDISEN